MVSPDEDEDAVPQRRRPHVMGTGWLLFVCAFLPTLNVCGDPVAPFEFPLAYVAYLGGAILAIIATARTLRARRGWFTAWLVLWLATAVAWASLLVVDASPFASLVAMIGGIVGIVFGAIAFHRSRYTARGMWIGGIVHGALSTLWYVLLATDRDALWGAYVGLASSIALLVATCVALGQHNAELERRRRETEPAPLPVARVVARD